MAYEMKYSYFMWAIRRVVIINIKITPSSLQGVYDLFFHLIMPCRQNGLDWKDCNKLGGKYILFYFRGIKINKIMCAATLAPGKSYHFNP